MDVRINEEDAFNLISELQSIVPYGKIIVLSAYSDPATMRQALLAGISDFIVKPHDNDELIAAIYKAGTAAMKSRDRLVASSLVGSDMQSGGSTEGKIVLVYGPKGVTGSSMISASIAAAMLKDNTKVALLDADMQFGDISIILNINWQFSVLNLTEQIYSLEPEDFAKIIYHHPASGLHVMVSPNRVEAYDLIHGDQFHRALDFMRRLYAYTVVDMPTVINDLSVNAIDAADIIVLLSVQELSALKNTLLFLNVCDQLKVNRKKIIFALNQYDKKIPLEKERIASQLKQPVDALIVSDPVLMSRSLTRGLPFYITDKEAEISKSIEQIAGLVRARTTVKA